MGREALRFAVRTLRPRFEREPPLRIHTRRGEGRGHLVARAEDWTSVRGRSVSARGTVEDTGYLRRCGTVDQNPMGRDTCPDCHAVVSDLAAHEAWHSRLVADIARAVEKEIHRPMPASS